METEPLLDLRRTLEGLVMVQKKKKEENLLTPD